MKFALKTFLTSSLMIPIISFAPGIISCSNDLSYKLNFDLDKNIKIDSISVNKNLNIKVTVNQFFALDEKTSYVVFSNEKDTKRFNLNDENVLKYSSNAQNNEIIIPFYTNYEITIYLRTISLEDWGNKYTIEYQSNFWNKLTYSEHDYVTTDNLYCSSQAEGIYMYTYAPGYKIWNSYLHAGREAEMVGEAEVIDQDFGFPSKEFPRDLDKGIWHKGLPLRLRDYKYVDDGLSLSKAGIKLTVFHGLETNEYELVDFLNGKLNIDIKNGNPEEARKVDLNILNNQSYVNLGWCATSLDKEFAMGWAKGQSAEFRSTPVLEITLNEDVSCAYVSSTNQNHMYFGTYLAWPHEYQILTQRNLKFTFTSGEWIKKDNGDNILYLKCRASLS